MIPTPADQDEADLRALFDASAPEASAPLLTKLSAKAADVPEHASRTPRWLPRWTWAPGLAGLAAAVGALAVTLSNWLAAPETDADSARAVSRVGLEAAPVLGLPKLSPSEPEKSVRNYPALPGQRRVAAAGEETAAEGAGPAEDLIAGMGGDWDSEGSPGMDTEFDALQGPTAEADLDAWLYATGELLEGG